MTWCSRFSILQRQIGYESVMAQGRARVSGRGEVYKWAHYYHSDIVQRHHVRRCRIKKNHKNNNESTGKFTNFIIVIHLPLVRRYWRIFFSPCDKSVNIGQWVSGFLLKYCYLRISAIICCKMRHLIGSVDESVVELWHNVGMPAPKCGILYLCAGSRLLVSIHF